MRKTVYSLIFFLLILITSCSPGTPQPTPQVVSVYSSSSAQPWLADIYTCAGSFIVIVRVDDPDSADIVLRIGEPEFLLSFAYQIDEEEILIVTHRQSPVQNMTLENVQTLFAGLGDPSVQVWVYASVEDVFEVFDRSVMNGRSVSSSSNIALTPGHMSVVMNRDSDAVGILPRRWKMGDMREVYSVAKVPVLAITQSEPVGEIGQLIGCLQK